MASTSGQLSRWPAFCESELLLVRGVRPDLGRFADLIVVDGDPLKDLSALEEVEVVVKGGEVLTTR